MKGRCEIRRGEEDEDVSFAVVGALFLAAFSFPLFSFSPKSGLFWAD